MAGDPRFPQYVTPQEVLAQMVFSGLTAALGLVVHGQVGLAARIGGRTVVVPLIMPNHPAHRRNR